MTEVKAPPIYDPVIESDGKARLPWILFFNSLFTGDNGTPWTPTFTSLTQTGTPTITGKYFRISRSLVYFWVRIVPGTNTSAVAGTTYINNFPLTLQSDGACLAVSGLLGSSAGMCDSATNRIYVPVWTNVTVALTIVGIVEAI